MRVTVTMLALLSTGPLLAARPATIPRRPIAQKGNLLFADEFDRQELGDKWRVPIGSYTIRDGVLVGIMRPEDHHGAVSETLVDFADAVIEFSFRFAGAKSFNVVIDDKKHKQSHAGHICRVSVFPNRLRLGDDKEGTMRNDIFAMRRDAKRRAEANKLLEGRSSNVPVKLKEDRWYRLEIEILGDQMRVSLDGKAIGHLKSPGIAHATKTDFGFTVNGSEMHFDDVKLWAATGTAKGR